MHSLRSYQQSALDAIASRYAAGVYRQLFSGATGMGKTEVFSYLIKNKIEIGENCLVLAHRDRLVTQAAQRIEGIVGFGKVGLVNADRKDWWTPCVVATVQSASVEKQLLRAPKFHNIIIDECFPAGTLIDGTPIEQIKVGDLVACYDHSNNNVARRKVAATMRRPAGDLLRLRFSDGETLTCTSNHPIYTVDHDSYIPAFLIRPGYRALKSKQVAQAQNQERVQPNQAANLRGVRQEISTQKLELLDDAHLFTAMQGDSTRSARQEGFDEMPVVRTGSRMQRPAGVKSSPQGQGVLLGCLQEEIHQSQGKPRALRIQPQALFGADEAEQSDQEPGSYRQNVSQIERANLSFPWRKWSINGTSEETRGSARLANGGGNRDRAGQGAICIATSQLQGRYWERGFEVRDRSGRQQPPDAQVEISRPAQDGDLECVRVDGVEILEPGSDGTYGGLCPDGYVYNLEVEEHHNYFAGGILAHNCHRSNSPSYRKVYDSLLRPGGLLLGVTATPNRTDKKGLIPHVFQELVYEIGMRELIDAGYLSKVIGKEIKLPIDFSKIKTAVSTDGIRDYRPEEVKVAFEEANWLERITEGWREVASDRRTIIFVPPGVVDGRGCGMAHSLAEYMRLHGIRAAAVDGTTKQGEQDRIIAEFTSGDVQVLVNVNIFTEGLDIPPIDAVLFARPTQSSIIYSQAIGRGTRLCPGKENCLVIDVTGITDQLAADGQSLMTLGKILPTDEQQASRRAERIKAARQLIRKLWRKHITLRLDENEEIVVRGQIGAKDKKKLDELIEEVKQVLAERDAGSQDEEPAEETSERRPVNTTLLTGNQLEIREIDFTRAAMRFDWDFDVASRVGVLWQGEFLYQVTRPDPGGKYLVESFLDRHGRLEPLRERGLRGEFETGKEARAFIERQIAANEMNKQRIFKDRNAPWRRKPITDKQRKRLETMNIPIPADCTSGRASDLLDEAFSRKRVSRAAR